MGTDNINNDLSSGKSPVAQPMHKLWKVRLAMVVIGTLGGNAIAAVSSAVSPGPGLPAVTAEVRQQTMPASSVSHARHTAINLVDFHQGAEPQYHFASLLQAPGFKRKSWHSFDAIQLGGKAVATSQTLTEVPLLPEEDKSQVTAKAVNRFVVVLDPGHGGSDPGSKAHNGLLEKELTLDIAKRAQLFLSEIDGIDVILTREKDRGLSRQSRVNAVRRSQADLMVSLHFNHLPQPDITLVESYYAGPANIAESQAFQRAQNTTSPYLPMADSDINMNFTLGSARLADMLQRRIYSEVSHANPAARNAGVKRHTLFVLTRSFTPSALIEMTCLSNELEATRLANDDYRDRLAAALVDGIRDYKASLVDAPLGEVHI